MNSEDLMRAHPWNATIVEERATKFEDLWHPYVALYVLHSVAAAVGFFLSLYAPGCCAAAMMLSGLSFVVSAFTGRPIWGNAPWSFIWYGVLIKWLIVNVFATVPVLILRAKRLSTRIVKIVSIFVYVILGSNIIWTLGMQSNGHVVVYLNRVAGVCLVIALTLHCSAVCRAGLGLFEVRKDFVYGFGTSFPWLVCYTTWNALFIAKITIGGVLQDILFWCMMYAYQMWDRNHLPIELYFAFARPVQLGTYIGFTEFVGLSIPYFYNATALTEEQPLPVNSHSFILFITFMNMLFSFFCVARAGHRLAFGLGYFQERFEEVHGIPDVRAITEYDDDDDDEESSDNGCC